MSTALVTSLASLLTFFSGIPTGSAGEVVVSLEPAGGATDLEHTLARAGELFSQGQDRFETSDFVGAIDLWTRAYESLPDGPEMAATRSLLLVNIAQAHVSAYAIDHEIDHLRRADVLFEDYLSMVASDDTETRETVAAQRERIAHALAAHEEKEAMRQVAEREALEEAARREARRERVEPTEAANSDQSPQGGFTKWERAMVIGGGVTLAFGIGTLGATGTFLWLRDEEEKDGRAAARQPGTTAGELKDVRIRARRFNRLAISTGAAAGVLTAIGLGLIGAARVHRTRRERRARVVWGPATVGASLTGRF